MHKHRLPYLLAIVLLFNSALLRPQGISILEVDSQLSLSPLLYEISGMCVYDNSIYALNDGGNGSYIFKLELETGKLEEQYRIRNIRNRDWEELTVFGKYLYIGDFGNNSGLRDDLAIHRIRIDSLAYPYPPVITTEINYLSHGKSKLDKNDNIWDCEAMVVSDEGIFCFSKNRKDLITYLYHISEEGKKNTLSPADSFAPGFMVTGACYDTGSKSLYLCGYYKNETYLLRYKNISGVDLSGEYEKYILPDLKNTQVESVFVSKNYIYLASEKTRIKQAIYMISLSSLE